MDKGHLDFPDYVQYTLTVGSEASMLVVVPLVWGKDASRQKVPAEHNDSQVCDSQLMRLFSSYQFRMQPL